MIERNGFTIHVDSPSERTARTRFRINGWIVADETVNSVGLSSNRATALSFYERPDVVRVFPARRFVRGFSGSGRSNDFGENGLQLAVQIGGKTIDLEHPLPPGAPPLTIGRRLAAAPRLFSLSLSGRLGGSPARRWKATLERHLFQRELRANIFRREQTDALLLDFAKAVPGAVFVQIGANDGLTGDPLHGILKGPGSRWRGVMVEPVAHLFEQLQGRYGSRLGLRLGRAAIGEQDGRIAIYRIRTEPGDPLWLEQLASLDREVLQRSSGAFGQHTDRIISEEVACLTVNSLLRQHGIESLDLVLIDTEGWDWRVLRQFDLEKLKPKLILYEHQHLSSSDSGDAHAFLAKHGYDWVETPEGDTVAWLKA